MKIKKENQLGLNFTQKVKDQFYKIHSDKFFSKFSEDEVAPYKSQWKEILNDEGNKNLLFTKTSQEVCEKIKIDKFEPSILAIKKEKKLTFLIDDTHFYRVCLKQGEIFAICVKKVLVGGMQFYYSYDSFKIFPSQNIVHYPPNQDGYLNDKYFKEFLRLLIFTEYSELEEVVLKPSQSCGTLKQGKYLNETTQSVIIVDSNWNKVVIRTEGFGVSGHFRLSRVGKNREGRKLIYISEFFKNGYVRGAKRKFTDN